MIKRDDPLATDDSWRTIPDEAFLTREVPWVHLPYQMETRENLLLHNKGNTAERKSHSSPKEKAEGSPGRSKALVINRYKRNQPVPSMRKSRLSSQSKEPQKTKGRPVMNMGPIEVEVLDQRTDPANRNSIISSKEKNKNSSHRFPIGEGPSGRSTLITTQERSPKGMSNLGFPPGSQLKVSSHKPNKDNSQLYFQRSNNGLAEVEEEKSASMASGLEASNSPRASGNLEVVTSGPRHRSHTPSIYQFTCNDINFEADRSPPHASHSIITNNYECHLKVKRKDASLPSINRNLSKFSPMHVSGKSMFDFFNLAPNIRRRSIAKLCEGSEKNMVERNIFANQYSKHFVASEAYQVYKEKIRMFCYSNVSMIPIQPRPEFRKHHRSPYTIVFDLNYTLMKVSQTEFKDYSYAVNVKHQTAEDTFVDIKLYVKTRPGLTRSLAKLAQDFELMVFSSATRSLTETLLKRSNIRTYFSHILGREDTTLYRMNGVGPGEMLKHLKVLMLGRDIKKIIVVTHDISIFGGFFANCVPIEKYDGSSEDQNLRWLLTYLPMVKTKHSVAEKIMADFEIKEEAKLWNDKITSTKH